ncbi:MAG: type II toxin-antitoxin system VapC family toxin [Chthoniobacterales bacterium]|jgi:tRNA(fMet)-specific endonuclease VapC
MRYLLDTSVFSQPLRRKPVEAALLRWKQAGDSVCAISAVTVAEVEYGLLLENRPQRREKFRFLLEGRLPVLETDAAVWMEFARRKARQKEAGRELADLDLLIASTALLHRLTVATLNVRDFQAVEGLACEDWSA